MHGLVLLCLASAVIAYASGNALVVGGFIVVYVATDVLLMGMMRLLDRSHITAEVSLSTIDKAFTATVGRDLQLGYQVSSDRTAWDALVVPILPLATTADQKIGRAGNLRAKTVEAAAINLVISEPGETVFPGLIIRRPSPLRLFSSPRFIPARATITVVPDCSVSVNPFVASFLHRFQKGERLQRRAIKNAGSDFQELREYRYPESIGRVDWKATARRRELIVRELHEPREFAIRVVIDASLEMMRPIAAGSRFAAGAALIGRLATVASSQGMGLTVNAYDRDFTFESRLHSGSAGLARLLYELAMLPRAARLRQARMMRKTQPLRVRAIARKQLRVLDAGLDRMMATYVSQMPGARHEETLDAVLADFSHVILNEHYRCTRCGAHIFDDEVRCGRCGMNGGAGELAPRAAEAAATLARLMRSSRGREMLVFISSLSGGEVCDVILQSLKLAARGHRTVHMVVPMLAALEDCRPTPPGSIGHFPDRKSVLQNLDKLHRASRVVAFRDDLIEYGVRVHAFDDAMSLDAIIESLLLSEVLAA